MVALSAMRKKFGRGAEADSRTARRGRQSALGATKSSLAGTTVHQFFQDLFFSVRALRRSSGFTLVAVLTLALGIAGTSVIFSLINATLLRQLPYPEPNRLIVLHWQDQSDISAHAFFMLKDRTHAFSSVAASYSIAVGVNLHTTGSPQYVKALSISKDFLPTLGIRPEIGNVFNAEEDEPRGPRTVILGHGLWVQGFNHDSSALGHELRINGESFTIIGIMPEGFRTYPDADIWLPLQLNPATADPGSNYRVVARLAPGISRHQAQFEIDRFARGYQSTYLPAGQKRTLLVQEMHNFLVEKQRERLIVLFAAVVFVFLIACTNVAVLILVRASESTHAIAIRAALGSSRYRLVRSRLTESLLLALAGGVLGLILTKESLPLVLWLRPADAPVIAALGIDSHVVFFTLVISVLSPLLFGLVPALKVSRVNLGQVLAYTSRTASSSGEQVRSLRMLVLGQMALTVMLMAGTMLLVRSLLNLYAVPLGFDTEHLFVAQLSLGSEQYRSSRSSDRLLSQVIKQLKALPGIESAAAVNGLPLENGLNVPLHPVAMPRSLDHADEYRPVSPGYFRTLRISLRSGRFFTAEDKAGSEPVAIINETMARRWWPDATAVGQFLKVDEELGPQPSDLPRRVVGVVSDIHEKGPGVPVPPTMFVPIPQTPDNINIFFNQVFLTSIVIRTTHRTDLSSQVRDAVQSVDPDLPLASFRQFNQIVDSSVANPRFIVLVIAPFSAFGLLLTAIGIHGVLNYQAHLRLREIGVRMAVGASRSQIVRMVARQGTKLISFAVLAGVAGSFLIQTLLGHLLYNMQSSSPVMIVGAGLLLGSVSTLISLLAAVRAASIEPIAVLRNE
ncbi:MAG: ABC transporter permease [Candidatus Angelobacter sp.]